jgi:hypothetical protein
MEEQRTEEVLTKIDELPPDIKDLIYSKHFLESDKPQRTQQLQNIIQRMNAQTYLGVLHTNNLNRMQRIIANANIFTLPFHYMMLGPEMRMSREGRRRALERYQQIRPEFERERERYRQLEMEQKRGQRY